MALMAGPLQLSITDDSLSCTDHPQLSYARKTATYELQELDRQVASRSSDFDCYLRAPGFNFQFLTGAAQLQFPSPIHGHWLLLTTHAN